jgi:primosomal protein N' (replication factor Y) (superfamily II helicase)
MDRDTVATRGRRRTIVDAMRLGKVDILVGTQMIAKGLDFPAVRLVGVISADQSLHIQDFRASERTFQLITQVIGRAGRSDEVEREGGGIAIIQSYEPDNPVLQTACTQDFERFYQSEIAMRFKFGYPPSVHLARIVISGAEKDEVWSAVSAMGDWFERNCSGSNSDIKILGPAPAPLEKLEGRWRFHFIMKAQRVSELVKCIVNVRKSVKIRGKLKVDVDIDPMSML